MRGPPSSSRTASTIWSVGRFLSRGSSCSFELISPPRVHRLSRCDRSVEPKAFPERGDLAAMPLMLFLSPNLPKIPCLHRDAFLVDAKPRDMIARGHWHRNLAGIVTVTALGLIASSCWHRERFV